MFIKLKNVESKTRLENLKEMRKFYCMKILPNLNIINDEKKGRDFAFSYVNQVESKSAIEKHFYKNYSNQEEEALFRLAEETRLVDKNQSIVQEFEYTTIKPEHKGLRSKELREILTNPKKRYEVDRALKAKFKYYSPLSKYELLKQNRNRMGLIDTAIEEGIDLNNPEEGTYQNLFNKTYANPDNNEHEEAALSQKNGSNENLSSFPLGHPNARFFRYDDRISFEDYEQDTPGSISFKNNRYENRTEDEKRKFIKEYTRQYVDPAFKEQEGFIVPHLERGNDEAEDKIFKRKPLNMFNDRKKLYKNELNQIEEFVNAQVSKDSSYISNDISEEDLNQALFEAQYQKPVEESDEFKRLEKRNNEETLALFKLSNITPHEFWNYSKVPKGTQMPKRNYYEAVQQNDPLYHLFSEVEQPDALRKVLKEWRKGTEIRTRLPYYPETKKSEKYFSLI